jgi:hypothetical protein
MSAATPADTPYQAALLRRSRASQRTRKRFPAGTRVAAIISGTVSDHYGTVERHVPGIDAQGGYLLVTWDANGITGRHTPINLAPAAGTEKPNHRKAHTLTDFDLTAPQRRIYDAALAGRTQAYNGLAKRPIDRLVALGLVTADFDMIPHAKGNGIDLSWKITVTAVRPDVSSLNSTATEQS